MHVVVAHKAAGTKVDFSKAERTRQKKARPGHARRYAPFFCQRGYYDGRTLYSVVNLTVARPSAWPP